MTEEKQSEKIVKMEDILKNSKQSEGLSKKETKISPKEKKKVNQETVPRGKPKSGKFWKSEKKKFSSTIKTRGIKSSFEKKQALRKKIQQVKEASRAVKEAKEQEKQQKKQRRRENLQRQEENRKKSEVVQVISNTKKLKRMKKKHLRSIEKRDTTTVKK